MHYKYSWEFAIARPYGQHKTCRTNGFEFRKMSNKKIFSYSSFQVCQYSKETKLRLTKRISQNHEYFKKKKKKNSILGRRQNVVE